MKIEREILDEKENENYPFSELIKLLTLRVILIFFTFSILWMISNSLPDFFKYDFPVFGILVLITIFINSRSIAFKYITFDLIRSEYKFCLIGCLSVFLSYIFLNLEVGIYFHFQGVRYGELIPVLVRSTLLSVFGFLFTLSSIRKLKNENYASVNWIIVALFILSSIMTNIIL